MSDGPASRRARLFLRTQAAWGRVLARIDSILTGLALGLMSRRTLQALDEEMYRRWAEFSSDEHNLRGLFEWEEKAYAGFLRGCRRIVVMAAGGGREAIALAARGHEVAAFECHPALLQAGQSLVRRVAPAISFEYLERDAAPAGVQADAVIVGWSAYTLTIGRPTRIALLRQLARLLAPGGPILISFFTRPAGRPRERWVARVAGAVRWLRRGEPVEEGDDLAPNWQHSFTEAEVDEELRAAGLVPACYAPPGAGRSASGWAVAIKPPSGLSEQAPPIPEGDLDG